MLPGQQKGRHKQSDVQAPGGGAQAEAGEHAQTLVENRHAVAAQARPDIAAGEQYQDSFDTRFQ